MQSIPALLALPIAAADGPLASIYHYHGSVGVVPNRRGQVRAPVPAELMIPWGQRPIRPINEPNKPQLRPLRQCKLYFKIFSFFLRLLVSYLPTYSQLFIIVRLYHDSLQPVAELSTRAART
ncbi:hypothetical protein F4781DRAFT_185903 [Annulohypoxylon bovei var. microspora]|nr:hypothetical protein F4781DRAFT_185903 [Annulohypoxylon bovei var. microspora]